ncbi:DNA-directed RNA polymerase subunit alpha C-terminal domain-containing protein [Limnohabitans sp. 15K]|uniref:DNA-directed RNA polymerase subunit alpha C-terminal domain-containing protein n=1 Tax=Limnohabitans sp. 15K TaxID=1100706 RepID=UPI000C1ECFE9|nr:DNA-directed RNA polymerase subunit alpha C-terminal domain-containing protein [Limnohabitans sp. 15K]PIT81961.1 hypothetical protein B9Z40_10260 [Limnohabitans sp. 15K]
MRPIRAFLFSQGENGQWGCQVFRDFEPLSEAAIVANCEKQYPVGVHVGFERPDTESVAELLCKQEGLVYLSNGAVGTMPLPVKASAISIGSAGECTFHTAIDGFGYQLENTDDVSSNSLLVRPTPSIPENISPRGWVASLSKHIPELAHKVSAAKIWDEDSYLLRESDLDLDTRYLAGLRRYEILESEQPNALTFIDHLKSAPPWLLNAPIALLNLSVRSNNVCAAHDLKTIGDFAKYGLKGLYKLPNLGQKSVHEISREMVHLFTTGHPLRAVETKLEWVIPARLGGPRPESESDENTKESDTKPSGTKEPATRAYANITEGLVEAGQNLDQNERGIWAARMGFRCEAMTFQQISDQIGLTRERVRQIEVKIYKKVRSHPFWDELSSKVSEHLRGRSAPLFLNGLSAIDPWFDGADDLVNPLRQISDNIARLGFHILTWNNAVVVSRMTQAQWHEAIDDAKSTLMAIADQNLSEQDALSQAAGALIGKGEDMREALLEEVSKFCIWSALPDGSRIFTGFGKSATALVAGLLQASDTPLHIDEIQSRIRANSSYEATNASNIRRAASEVCMLFGRGTYGLMKHCPLNASQMLAVRAEAEDIVAGGAPSKQWHSSELYNELLNRGFSYEGKLDKYIINIALANSSSLVYLRRMIWGVRGEWKDSADARLDVKQAIVSLIESEGKPMTTAQIRSKLIEDRGLNIHFQIWATSPLVRIGPGIWGLEGRDVDMEQAGATAYRLLKELSARQEGMHVSEAAAFLGLGSEDEVSMLTSIGNKDGLRMDKGQYCYLQPWGESRRISVWEAATSTLKDHPQGLARSDLQMYVERIAKRKIDRQQLSGILQNIDAIYDATSGLWKFAGLVGADDENEEEIGSLSDAA